MNEVTKIHLGREAFAISAEAHHELRNYLDAIKRRVHDDDIVSEIEMRMAELLTEHGVSDDKVILPADVAFLKEQLGDPKDFAEEGQPEPAVERPSSDTKRLFRDTDNAMLAGVAAGLANYFGIDALLIRLLFIIATFAGGWGVLAYIVMWLLVPEAKTPSDHLQMAGKPVTIDSLKEVVERADVRGAAQRANKSLAGPINILFNTFLKIIGVCFVVIGLAMLLSLIGSAAYTFLKSGVVVQDGIFPVGLKEHLVIYIAASVFGIISLFVIIFGLAIFWRKWPIRSWLTGTLIGLMLLGIAVGSALTADIVPQVRNRYNANIHTTTYNVQQFSKIDLTNENDNIRYEYSPNYSVALRYFGHPSISSIKYSVKNGVLALDTRQFDQHRYCDSLCLPDGFNMTIIVRSPQPPIGFYPDIPVAPDMPIPPKLLQN